MHKGVSGCQCMSECVCVCEDTISMKILRLCYCALQMTSADLDNTVANMSFIYRCFMDVVTLTLVCVINRAVTLGRGFKKIWLH